MNERASWSSRDWPEIAAFFDLLAERQPAYSPMRSLVQKLLQCPQASDLERNTSMHSLLVSNAPAKQWRENVLKVTYHPGSAEFEFEYWHYDGDSRGERRRCAESEGWGTLVTFVRYKFGIVLNARSQTGS